ncbi:MAG: hypothetical protein ACUVTL_07125 [Thermoproteota archaeon]
MKSGSYVCIAILLAGLFTWGLSYLLEPKLFFITGNLKSFRAGDSSWLSPFSGYVTPLKEDNLTGESQMEIGNKSLAALTTHYGSSINVSRTMRATVEDPSGRRIGVGFIIETQEAQKLVVVLPDGWIQEYTLPVKG